jgi:hypothetical protein
VGWREVYTINRTKSSLENSPSLLFPSPTRIVGLLTTTSSPGLASMPVTSLADAPLKSRVRLHSGRARWTVRLLAEEAVKRKLVPRVGRETVRVLLESHDLRWRGKNVVRGGTG